MIIDIIFLFVLIDSFPPLRITAFADLIAREEIIKMIIDNFSLESTIIISSHLVSDIEKMLDRVLFLKSGQIVCNKLVEDLRDEGKSVVDLYKEVYGNV